MIDTIKFGAYDDANMTRPFTYDGGRGSIGPKPDVEPPMVAVDFRDSDGLETHVPMPGHEYVFTNGGAQRLADSSVAGFLVRLAFSRMEIMDAELTR